MKLTTKQGKQYPQRKSACFRLFAAIIAIGTAAVSLSSCSQTAISAESPTDRLQSVFAWDSTGGLNIGRDAEDSLNPYFMTSGINRDIISLVFEPLFSIDDSFAALPNIADSFSQSGGGLTVEISPAALFSDGSKVTAADVVYSFNLAKSSKSYAQELSGVTAAAASGTGSVTFTVTGRGGAESLHFPIVKSSTAENAAATPIGTGLYSFNTETSSLSYNPYSRRPEPNIKTVNLIEIPQSSTLIHTLEMGVIDSYFDDLSSGSYSHGSLPSCRTNLTNLVFLGMNSSSYGLSSPAVRQSVYYSLNRQSIVRNSFKNYAVESYTPYHPEWHVFASSGYNSSSMALDYAKAQQLMTAAGFNDIINLRLIVYSGNGFKIAAANEIKENLALIGINLTVELLTWDEYNAALIGGNYDFYLGEIKLPVSMDMSALFGTESVIYGAAASDATAAAYGEFAAGNISVGAFTDSFMQNMPFAPVCFRMGTLVYSDRISPAADCDLNNAYKNISQWSIAPQESTTE